ncbi:MAG: hypothetical protein E7Z87_08310 [Cyanobacteria bacterium SIG26]|nr:hypothetical protein [Cyanobacteria bacterium SIG26]
MSCSKMLSRDLEKLESSYQHKFDNIAKLVNLEPTEERIQIWNNCYKALDQIRRLRAVFERTF